MSLLVLNASAGSGKTYRLVQEYLYLLFLPVSDSKKFKSLLAMTFTNKAALEMKERILLALNEIASFDGTNDGTQQQITSLSLLTERPYHEFPSRAQEILSEILHNYEDFMVSTIDKFNLRLIRSFHRDLNLPQEFEVVMNESEIMEKVVDALLVNIGTEGNEALTRLVENYTKKNLEEETQWNFRNQLISFCSILSKERYFGLVKQLLDTPYSEQDLWNVKDQQRALVNQLLDQCKTVHRLFVEAAIPLDKLPQKGNTQRAFEKLGAYEAWPEAIVTSVVIKTLQEGKYDRVFSPVLLNEFRELLDFFDAQHERHCALVYYQETFYNLALLQYVAREMAKIRTEEQFVRISEFNALIGNLVQHQHAPFIYERLGNRIHHFMLDEFQDTSRLQWMNLVPLVEESLSKGNKNLIVGDAKQSIYRFNNGLAEQFVALPRIFNPDHDPDIQRRSDYFNEVGTLEVMSDNYRSGKKIVEFNNLLFDSFRPFLPDNGYEFYGSIEQNPIKTFEGYVEILSEPKKESSVDIFSEILIQIERCIADGFKPGDICILSEKNRQGNEIALFLTRNNYKVVSSDSLLIDSDQRVRLVIAYLKIRNKNAHQKEVMKFAEMYLRILHEDSELKYLNLFSIDPINGKKKFNDEAFFNQYFEGENAFYFNYNSLYELFQQFYEMMGWKETDDIYLHHFCDIAYNFQQGKKVDLNSFLEYYDRNKHKLAIHFPKTDDAIQIMTIHKSKGLQFPVVILPSIDFKMSDTISYYLIDGQEQVYYRKLSKNSPIKAIRDFTTEENDQFMMDKVNLLYVALTRPIHRLYAFNIFEYGGKMVDQALFELYPEAVTEGSIRVKLGEETPVTLPLANIEYYHPIAMEERLWHPALAIRKEFESNDVRLGNAFHEIISLCSTREAMEQYLERLRNENILSQLDCEYLAPLIIQLMNNVTYQEWNSSAISIQNEAWIMNHELEVLRPDKIIETSDKIIIIDFKTGEKQERHKKQLRGYEEAVRGCFDGSKPIETHLYYAQSNEWVSC
ncbi:MAG: UvrD-helicase domain-containing protein [Bacteroidota bacterium]